MKYQNHFPAEHFPYKDVILTDNSSFTNHCHKELEIIHVRKGCLKILYDQIPYTLNEGDIVIFPPYINHAILAPENTCERFVIELDAEIAEGTGNANQRSSYVYHKYFYNVCTLSTYWTPDTYSKVKTIIYNMHDEYVEKQKAWEFSIKTFTNLLILTAIRSFPEQDAEYLQKDNDMMKLQKAIAYIADNYDTYVSLEECAKLCDFNTSYFSKYFKKHMGITFQNYVKNTRIEHAKWLLMTTSDPITEISLQCGFSDIRIFNKIFKQETQETASHFRKSL